MSQTVYGAVVTVKLDIGGPPIILGRDILDSTALLHDAASAMTDLTNPVLSINATWGANDPRGILTDVEAGRCVISFVDEARDMDPGNIDAVGIMTPGASGQVLVDGTPVFTGFMDLVSHDLALGVTTVILQDAVARLSAMTVAVTLPAGDTESQLTALMAAAGWPDALWLILGPSISYRGEDSIVMSAWAALNRLKDAELGNLWVDQSGVVILATRDEPLTGDPVEVGDGGIPLMDIVTTNRRVGIVNDIVIDMDDPYPDRHYDDGTSIGRNGRRSVAYAQDDLRLL